MTIWNWRACWYSHIALLKLFYFVQNYFSGDLCVLISRITLILRQLVYILKFYQFVSKQIMTENIIECLLHVQSYSLDIGLWGSYTFFGGWSDLYNLWLQSSSTPPVLYKRQRPFHGGIPRSSYIGIWLHFQLYCPHSKGARRAVDWQVFQRNLKNRKKEQFKDFDLGFPTMLYSTWLPF